MCCVAPRARDGSPRPDDDHVPGPLPTLIAVMAQREKGADKR
jgi:hypothetical protein